MPEIAKCTGSSVFGPTGSRSVGGLQPTGLLGLNRAPARQVGQRSLLSAREWPATGLYLIDGPAESRPEPHDSRGLYR
jgi:hypothetical protein